ncbi:MAG TPA: iron-sulfur cluster biosynthesis protein [Pseudonocardiaceae bacterium]|jgi:Fe-S cluster assembly iron-binding protein IscA|nr:iron-sulfur cluster biosynthesis protein [Pseudonocardiaceae bacterium]
MLALTPAAAEVVSAITSGSGMPETAGLRIAPTQNEKQESGLELQLVSGPAQQDQVVAETGARVFLEPQAAAYLADKVLDGGMDEQGRASFTVVPQANNGSVPTA